MLLPENEAILQIICPMRLVRGAPATEFCIGHTCGAWRYKANDIRHSGENPTDRRGFCGVGGNVDVEP